MWNDVIKNQYITLNLILEWIHKLDKSQHNASVMWKETMQSFDLIGKGLVWKMGDGHKVYLYEDLWIGSEENQKIMFPMIIHL